MQESNFLLYTAPSGDVRLDVRLFEESIWLTQKAMAELFEVGVPAISKHFSNIFESGELVEDSVISILETTAADGKNVNKFLEFYEYKILKGLGNKSKKQASTKAFSEYDKFNKTQKIESDFDKMIKNKK